MRPKPLATLFNGRLPQMTTSTSRALSYDPSRLHPLETYIRRVAPHATPCTALHLFDQLLLLRHPLPHVSTFNILLALLVRSGRHRAALSMYSGMLSLGVPPAPHTHATLAHCFSRMAHPDLALAVLSDALRRGNHHHPPVLGAVVHALCAAGRLAEAVGLLVGARPDVVSHTTVVDGACRAGEVSLAMAVVGRMVKVGCRPNQITLNVLVDGLCTVGRIAVAAKVFDEMPRVGHPADVFTFATLVGCCCRLGRVELGFGLFGCMLKRGVQPDKEILTVLANGLCDVGQLAEGTSLLLRRMPEMGWQPDVVALNSLVRCFGSMERVDLGFAVFGAMIKRGWHPSVVTFNSLVNGLCVAGRVAEAAALLVRMEKMRCSPNIVTYNTLIKGHVRIGRVDAAIELLHGMVGSVISMRPDLITYATIMDGLCKGGDVDGAARLFEEMKREGIVPSAYLYRLLIRGYTHLGRWSEAVQLINKLASETIN